MKRVVLDTNCLLMSIPQHSPYRDVWTRFLLGEFELCVSNEILEEYQEILAKKTTPSIASNVVSIMLNAPNICLVTPYYRFGLIGLLERLAKKMGWGMTRSVVEPSSTDKLALLQRLYGCVNLPADFDYKTVVSEALDEKYGLR